MKIYVAGAYSKGDVAENVRAAIYDGDYVSRLGHAPFIPHLTHFWHMLIPHDYEFWMSQDEQWLSSCDAILRLKGESLGADREVSRAIELGLPVYRSVFEVPKNTCGNALADECHACGTSYALRALYCHHCGTRR